MLPYRDSRITIVALLVFFVGALGYAAYEARGILEGPSISVSSQVTVVHDPYIVIQGQASRIVSLSMNGQQIAVTQNGVFKQPFLLSAGYNRIVLDAKDSYGRSKEQIIEIVYAPATTTPTESATSTSPASSTAPLPQPQ